MYVLIFILYKRYRSVWHGNMRYICAIHSQYCGHKLYNMYVQGQCCAIRMAFGWKAIMCLVGWWD